MKGLSLSGIKKGFGDRPVLRGVDLEIEVGSLCVVVGRSGAGKSTLLRIICGLTRPEAGTIELEGRLIEGKGFSVPAGNRGVGYVPQDAGLLPHLTALENVAIAMTGKRKRERALELLQMTGVASRAESRPDSLSGGEKQKVALARALAKRPRLLLLDEPFGSVDAPAREELRAELRRVVKELSVTTLLVTHDRDEALSLADVVAVLAEGKLYGPAPPAELYANPPTPEVGTLLGPLNVFTGRLAQDRGGVIDLVEGLRVQLEDGDRPPDLAGLVTCLARPENVGIEPSEGPEAAPVALWSVSYYGHDALVEAHLQAPRGLVRVLVRTSGPAPSLAGRRVRLFLRRGPGLSLRQAPTSS
jgi:iron(III) transport system ATP-binding protein